MNYGFVMWFNDEGNGIYYDPRNGKYTCTVGDIEGLSWDSLEAIHAWMTEHVGGKINAIKV